MSLFGGGETSIPSTPPPYSPGFPEEESDFSIEEIRPPSPVREQSVDFSDYEPEQQDAQDAIATQDDHGNTNDAAADVEDNNDDGSVDEEGEGRRSERNWARTWRHYTSTDRAIHDSLTSLRNAHLSLHLFNAHALKLRLRRPETIAALPAHARKSRWIPKTEDGERQWYPDAEWSAWPHENVPKSHETVDANRDGLGKYTIGGITKPASKEGQDLQQEVEAVFLRRAKNMWESRSFARREEEDETIMSIQAPVPTTQDVDASVMEVHPQRVEDSVAEAQSQNPDASVIDVPSQSLDASVVEVSAPTSAQLSPSQQPSPIPTEPTARTGVKNEDEKDDQDVELLNSRPVFSADDDRSHQLLAPTVNHVMSQLDSLLLALHHHREGQYIRLREAGDTSDDSTRSVSTNSTSRTRSQTSRRGRATTPAATSRRTRSVSQTTPKHVDIAVASPSSSPNRDAFANISDSGSDYSTPRKRSRKPSSKRTSATPSPSSKYTHGKHSVGLRDWSEVLGLASMNAFPPSVIARARKRCETLFNEKMTFRNFPEHGPVREEASDDFDHANNSQEDTPTTTHGVFRCPFRMCERNALGFEKGYRWRDHLKQKHKKNKAQIALLEKKMVSRLEKASSSSTAGAQNAIMPRQKVLDYNPKNWTPPDPLRCPHCVNSPLYPRVSRLLDHLRRTHKYDPRTQDPPSLSSASKKGKGKARQRSEEASSSSSSDDEDEAADDADAEGGVDEAMLGGVHLDGFLQPVLGRGGRGKDKAARLAKGKEKRSKVERKAAKRKRELIEDEEIRIFSRSQATRQRRGT